MNLHSEDFSGIFYPLDSLGTGIFLWVRRLKKSHVCHYTDSEIRNRDRNKFGNFDFLKSLHKVSTDFRCDGQCPVNLFIIERALKKIIKLIYKRLSILTRWELEWRYFSCSWIWKINCGFGLIKKTSFNSINVAKSSIFHYLRVQQICLLE